MSSTISSCSAAPPLPLSGGGGASSQPPAQAPGQNPMQAPLQSSAVQGAAGGGEALRPPAPSDPPFSAPIATPVSGGGGADLSAILPALTAVISSLSAVVNALSASIAAGQAQAGAAGVAGGGGVAGANGGGASSGCSCAGSMVAMSAGTSAGANGAPDAAPPNKSDRSGPPSKKSAAPPAKKSVAGGGGSGKLSSKDLTVKGTKMDDKQRFNLEAVLKKGKEMGANAKVLTTAVATVIQESLARNDSSVDTKDHDSLGLFQQRPSMGWGTRAQISDPAYAAMKFFEKAIPNDKKNPDKPMTLLAQSVQISAFPNAYARWESEAAKIVADFNS
ncbi:MAG: hypothetical protein ABI200_01175 [Gaiellales bacterium]